MGGNLSKTPLLAVVFASALNFAALFFPVSAPYYEAQGGFVMPVSGYIFMVAYGFWIAAVAALAVSGSGKGARPIILVALALLLTQLAAPAANTLFEGEATGVMSRADVLYGLAAEAVAVVFMLVTAALLFKAPQDKAPAKYKYKIRTLGLIVRAIVLPLTYCTLHFVAWYFLLWRVQAARVYYGGSPDSTTFSAAIVNMLLNDFRQIPLALLTGLLYTAGIIFILFLMPDKRPMFAALSVMMMCGPALKMLIPDPLMPQEVRMAQLFQRLAMAAAFGVLGSVLLHTSVKKTEAPQPKSSAAPATNAQASQLAAQAKQMAAAAKAKS
jgi:hypothetical protein